MYLPTISKDRPVKRDRYVRCNVTAAGTVGCVPTTDLKIYQDREDKRDHQMEEATEAMGGMYIDTSKRSADDVSSKMRDVSHWTSRCSRVDERRRYIPLPRTSGKVRGARFQEVLEIYENDQLWYLEEFDEGFLSEEELSEGLSRLEEAFCSIVEDDPQNERYKEIHGRSIYCDLEAVRYLSGKG